MLFRAAAALALVLTGAAAAPWNVHKAYDLRAVGEQPWQRYNQSEEWYSGQRLDHFNLADGRTWSQRYFVIDDFYKGPGSPVILHICGEYTCPGIMPARCACRFAAASLARAHPPRPPASSRWRSPTTTARS